MKKYIKKIVFAYLAILIAAIVFTLSFKDSSIGSLRADAKIIPCECIARVNHDCKSPTTGNIYSDLIWSNNGGGVVVILSK
jgi:hypothetical protein